MKVQNTPLSTPLLGQINPVHALFFSQVLKLFLSGFPTEISTQNLWIYFKLNI
jgi:hypothetical protein